MRKTAATFLLSRRTGWRWFRRRQKGYETRVDRGRVVAAEQIKPEHSTLVAVPLRYDQKTRPFRTYGVTFVPD